MALETIVMVFSALCCLVLLCATGFLYIYWVHDVVRTSSRNIMAATCIGAALGIAGVVIRIRCVVEILLVFIQNSDIFTYFVCHVIMFCSIANLSATVCVLSPWLVGVGFVICCSSIFLKAHRLSVFAK